MTSEQIKRKLEHERQDLRLLKEQQEKCISCSKEWWRIDRLISAKKRGVAHFEKRL